MNCSFCFAFFRGSHVDSDILYMVMAESFFVTFHKSPLPSLMETSRRTLDNFLNITFSPPWILYGLSHNIIGLRRLPFSSY